MYYAQLPDTIPRHFGPAGQPDAYGAKELIGTLPAIGSLLYLDLVFLNHYPHIFHYPVKITAEHAPRPYRLAIRRVRVLKCVIVGSFAYLTYATLGNREGLGTFFLLVFLPLTLGSTECFVYRALTKC